MFGQLLANKNKITTVENSDSEPSKHGPNLSGRTYVRLRAGRTSASSAPCCSRSFDTRTTTTRHAPLRDQGGLRPIPHL
jgi:hypothetical protein